MRLAIYGTDNSLNNKHAEDLVTYKEIIKINSINLAKEKIKENINLNINSSMKENYINEAIDDIKLWERIGCACLCGTQKNDYYVPDSQRYSDGFYWTSTNNVYFRFNKGF